MQIAALVYFCTEVSCLKITPDANELVLTQGATLTLTCSSFSKISWEFKRDDMGTYLREQDENGHQGYQIVESDISSVLTLRNVSWKHTGVYQCRNLESGETKEAAVFVPGEARLIYLQFHLKNFKAAKQLLKAKRKKYLKNCKKKLKGAKC